MTVSLSLGSERKRTDVLWHGLIVLLALVAMVGCQGLSSNSTAPPKQQATPGTLGLSGLALNFGNVVVGSSNTLSITATNGGTSAAIVVSSVVSTETQFTISGPKLPATVEAGQGATWKITFSPTAVGSLTASLSIASDASDGSVSASLTGVGLAPGQLAAPASVGFGAVTLGKSQSKSVTLSNAGGSTVTISQATVSGSGFQLSGFTAPLTLNPGQSLNLGVVFDPLATGTVNGSISLTTSASMAAPAAQQRRAATAHLTVNAADTGSSIVTIAVSGQGVTPGQLALSPASVSFSNVQDGTSQSQSVTLTNTGGSTVNISQAAVSGTGFSVAGLTLPLALAAGQSATFSVSFAPQSAGAVNGSIAVVSDGANPALNLPLSGTGVTPGSLTANPTTTNFGSVAVSHSQQITETLTNSGGESVIVSQATATGTGFSLSGLTLPLTLTAGQSASFSVTFSPQSSGSTSGNIAITSNASNPTLNIALSGNGLAAGSLVATPSSLSFGNDQDGNAQTLSETLTNTGGSSVDITQATVTGAGFSITGLNLPLTLTAGQSSPTFNVVFTPQTAGAVNGNLSITSNASNPTLAIPLSGTGVTPGLLTASSTSLSFGNVQTGNTKSLAETLTNSGGSSLKITQANVTGAGLSVTGLNLPLTLGPGQSSLSFNVVFAPTSAGVVSGSLALTSNASNPSFSIPLTGTGVTPGQIAASPASLSFGSVQTGANKTLTETLTNSGGSSVTISQAAVTGAGLSMNGLSLPLTLTAGQSSPTFNVVFAPNSAGAVSGNIAITSNGSNPTLNVAVSATGVTPGSLSASPTSLSFGSVQTGSSKTLTETLTNSGGSSVTITQATPTGAGYSINGLSLPLTLTPGQSSPSFNVVFAPGSATAVSGNLAITSNASNPTLNIALSGTGVTPATLAPTQSSLSFGSVQVGSNKSLSETVTNTGGASATISQDTVTGTGFTVSGLTPPVTLTSGQSVTFSVIFTPPSAASDSGNLAIASNASNPTLNITLSGTGTASGQLAVSPTSLAFGSVAVGATGNLTATLNATGSSVTVSSVNLSSSEFSVSGISFPATITAGNSLQFTVTFTPQATGAASGTASFVSNAANTPTVLSLGGTGTAPPVHSVALSWTASSSSNITGYNIYRGPAASGPFTQINPSLVAGTAYTDNSVVDGQTYYYAATAVDSDSQESAKSTPAGPAVIPPP
jgi:Abnormal spindle-like microcephaly-assoc'd, ASPM-SPD-2-Hydin